MAGHFYPPPSTFIGGRQPYAPPLGLVQSGLAPSAPPPVNRASLQIIEARYRVDPTTVIYVGSIAPLLQTPAVPDNPPPSSYANQRVILGRWELPYRPIQGVSKLAPLLAPAVTPDNPPRFGYSVRNTILASWVPPYRPIPRLQISEIVTEVAPDTTPDAFSFTDQSGVARSSTITSDPITVVGINTAASISVTGGSYDINGSGSFTSSPGTVNNGDTVRARQTSSASYLTATNTIVTIGGVSDTFTSITQGDPAQAGYIGRPFNFNWWSN